MAHMRKRDGEEHAFSSLVRLSFAQRAWPEKRPRHPQRLKPDLLLFIYIGAQTIGVQNRLSRERTEELTFSEGTCC